MINGFLEYISTDIDLYDNFLLVDNFSSEPTEESMTRFCKIHNSKNLLDKLSCYKTPRSPSCVNWIVTNMSRNFQNACTFETGLSDFCKMTLTVLK